MTQALAEGEQTEEEWLEECREKAAETGSRFASGIGTGDRVLSAPACQRGCSRCVRECAVRQIIANWWATEHAKAEFSAYTRSAATLGGIVCGGFGSA